jgi:hypothetical protein
MIFRAVFWIGLVSLLAPHEPDLGLGRPGAGTLHLSPATFRTAADGLSAPAPGCGSACAGGLGLLPDILHFGSDSSLAQGLAEVKAEITADQRARREASQRS